MACGGSSAGLALFVQNGKLVYHYDWHDQERTSITSAEPLPSGESVVRFEVEYRGEAEGKG